MSGRQAPPQRKAGHRRFVALVGEPPCWELPPPGGPAYRRLGIARRPFRSSYNLRAALVLCRRLRGAGSVMERTRLRDLVALECRGDYRTEKAWQEGFRLAIFGARKYGWIETFELQKDLTVAQVPGAPCAVCSRWLTPHERGSIAEQRQTPYSACGVKLWDEPDNAR